jgi:hypothetical protein
MIPALARCMAIVRQRRRWVLPLLALCVLAGVLAVVPAPAASADVVRHDFSHPIRMPPDTPATALDRAMVWLGPIPILPPSRAQSQLLAHPLDANPFAVCREGVAYAQGEMDQGSVRWWIGGIYDQITAYVLYFWCPGTTYAAGYNFAYTVEWFNRTYAPRWPHEFTLGQEYSRALHTILSYGATLERMDGRLTGDDAPLQTFSVAMDQVVADYSMPQDGRYRYKGILHVSALDVSAGPPSGAVLDFQVADPTFV